MYQRDIMERAGILSRQTCARAVKELVARGMLTVQEGTKQPGQTKPAPNLYRLLLPASYVAEDNIAMSTSATYLRCGEQHSNEEQSAHSSDAVSSDDLDDDVECPKGIEDLCMWGEFMAGLESCVTCGRERRSENGTNHSVPLERR